MNKPTISPMNVYGVAQTALDIYRSSPYKLCNLERILELPDDFDGYVAGALLGCEMLTCGQPWPQTAAVRYRGQLHSYDVDRNLTVVVDAERMARELEELLERQDSLDVTADEPFVDSVLLPLLLVRNLLLDEQVTDDNLFNTVDRIYDDVAERAPDFV